MQNAKRKVQNVGTALQLRRRPLITNSELRITNYPDNLQFDIQKIFEKSVDKHDFCDIITEQNKAEQLDFVLTFR